MRLLAGLGARRGRSDLMTWRKSIPSPALWAVWLATRTVLYLLVTAPGTSGDVGIYQRWYACCLSHGSFPVADPMWQYPPGAALVFWLPGRLPGSYVDSFVFLAIGCDLAITLMLCSPARRGGSLAGAWYWVCGVPLLGVVTVTRFDMVPVALSVAALCLTSRGGARGALIGARAAVKVWPVTLLAGMAPGQWRRGLAATAVVLAAVCVTFPSATAGSSSTRTPAAWRSNRSRPRRS
ncbi:MAG TPA: hypothetical protein DHU96_19430 [Actinobacteria bacterium]|nr:hypothetical protein [Actinomycetota bacterium]